MLVCSYIRAAKLRKYSALAYFGRDAYALLSGAGSAQPTPYLRIYKAGLPSTWSNCALPSMTTASVLKPSVALDLAKHVQVHLLSWLPLVYLVITSRHASPSGQVASLQVSFQAVQASSFNQSAYRHAWSNSIAILAQLEHTYITKERQHCVLLSLCICMLLISLHLPPTWMSRIPTLITTLGQQADTQTGIARSSSITGASPRASKARGILKDSPSRRHLHNLAAVNPVVPPSAHASASRAQQNFQLRSEMQS